jgi:hypothetical protein
MMTRILPPSSEHHHESKKSAQINFIMKYTVNGTMFIRSHDEFRDNYTDLIIQLTYASLSMRSSFNSTLGLVQKRKYGRPLNLILLVCGSRIQFSKVLLICEMFL